MSEFEKAFNQLSKVSLENHTEVWGEPKTERAFFEAGQASKQAEIDGLKTQLNNMEACYIEKKKQVEELQGQLKTWKGQSLAAMLHGTCKCGEPWQSIVSDREGFNLLHCFNCNNDRYENKEFFGDHEPKSMRGGHETN